MPLATTNMTPGRIVYSPKSLRERPSGAVSKHARRGRAPLGGVLAPQAAALHSQLELYVRMKVKMMVSLKEHSANELLNGERRGVQ